MRTLGAAIAVGLCIATGTLAENALEKTHREIDSWKSRFLSAEAADPGGSKPRGLLDEAVSQANSSLDIEVQTAWNAAWEWGVNVDGERLYRRNKSMLERTIENKSMLERTIEQMKRNGYTCTKVVNTLQCEPDW